MAAGSTLKETHRTLSTARSPPVSAMTTETTSTRHTALGSALTGTVVPRKLTRSYKSDRWTWRLRTPDWLYVSPKVGLRTVGHRAMIRRRITRFHVEDNAETQPASVRKGTAGPPEAPSPGEPLPPFSRIKRRHRVFPEKVVGVAYREMKPTPHTI